MQHSRSVRIAGLFALLALFLSGGVYAQPAVLSPAHRAGPAPGVAGQAALPGAASLGGVAAVQGPDDPWAVGRVDAPRDFDNLGQRSLALDGEGRPHLVYAGTQLYYAWYDGSRWQVEVVDSALLGTGSPSLALDGAGQAHIGYQSGGSLKYAWRSGETWQVQTVGGGGYNPSLVLDADGHPHVSYGTGAVGSQVRYAWYDGVSWTIQTVDGGESPSLALDAAGRPQVSYTSTVLKHAWYDGAAWHTEIVDLSTGSGSSLALDGAGRPHISYSAGQPQRLKYAWHDGLGWRIETVSASGEGPSLVLDGAGLPHIGYRDGSALKYAYHDGLNWQFATVLAGETFGDISLLLDASGYPQMDCLASSSGELKVAWNDGAAWQATTVDSTGDSGRHSDLALDAAGWPHVSYCHYHDYENPYPSLCDSLKYAFFDGSAWQVVTVERGTDVGYDTSVGLDEAGRPHISYRAGDALRYAAYDGSSWQLSTVDGSGVLGYGTSMALDAAGQPHVSYSYGGSLYALKYAWSSGPSWYTEIVEVSTVAYFRHSALALDAAGRPHISYGLHSDLGGDLLRYAWHDGVDWHVQTVDSGAGVGGYTSLALDAGGHPHISYTGAGNSLRYAWHDGTSWHIQTVDSVGGYTSLALDAAGRPHVSYYDWGSTRLKYAWHDGTAWHLETPDGAANVGTYSALALDGSDRPYIAYYDAGGHDLRFAHQCTPLSAVEVSGPDILPVWGSGLYTANPLPPNATPPIAYTWDNGTAGPTAFYSWPAPGTYSITVNAANLCGQAQGLFWVNVTCQPVEGLQVEGPRTLPTGRTGTYQAIVQPISASLPVTITWNNGTVGPTASYSWMATGTYTVAVTATNPCGQVREAFSVTAFCQGVEGLQVEGPSSLPIGQPGTYQAVVQPLTPSLPITIAWSNGTAGLTATYSWATTGTHNLLVTATNDCGEAQGSFSVTVFCDAVSGVEVSGPPVLLVGEAGTYQAAVQPISATGPVTITWDNGTVGPTALYSWTMTGTFTLTVTATNPCGLAHQAVAVQVVEAPHLILYLPAVFKGFPPPCQPVTATAFSWEPLTPTAGQVVTFTGSASGTLPVTYTWDFGDSSWAVGPASVVTHTYPAAGTYTATLVAANACGQGTAVHTLTVVCTAPYAADFFWEPLTPTAGQVVTLTGSVSGSEPMTYTWDFGDSSWVVGPPSVVTHSYALTGTYTVTLTAANACGQDTAVHTLTVVCTAPYAAGFSWGPFTPTVGQVVTFTGSASGTLPIGFAWDTGDGFTGTGALVTHTYVATGTYTVTMTAGNACGQVEVVRALSVVALPPPCQPVTGTAFSWEPLTPTVGQVVTFTGSASGTGPIQFTWAMGDGITRTGAVVTHTYAVSGTFTVTLVAANACGQEVVSLPLVVSPPRGAAGNGLWAVAAKQVGVSGRAAPRSIRPS